ncbi:MAG: plasmid partitioning protein RepB C-terminal domain-containing protein [Verrucomicrobiota bacterium]
MSKATAKIGFKMETVQLRLENILPVRQVTEGQKKVGRYDVILNTLKTVGLVEPLVVYPQKGLPGNFILLNGHMRYLAMKELGMTTADCLIASDDERFTYNARINRLTAIQEHRMITRAVNNGASRERIAMVLNMKITSVVASINLLSGIHPKAVELLKDKPISAQTLRMLTKVTGARQVEIAQLLVNANNYCIGYVEGLVIVSIPEKQATTNEPEKKQGMTREAIAKMAEETQTMEIGMKDATKTYHDNIFTLQIAKTFIKSLLENMRVDRYLKTKHSEIHTELQAIAAAETVAEVQPV